MNRQQFLKQRQVAWQRFEQLLERRQTKRRGRLTAAETSEFSRLLREISNDLAIIRSRDWGQRLVTYLNPLVARGHNSFYRSTPGSWRIFLTFLTVGFPRVLRRNGRYFLLSCLLFFLPLAIAWVAVQQEPSRGLRIVSADQLDAMDQMYRSDSKPEDERLANPDKDAAPEETDKTLEESVGDSNSSDPVEEKDEKDEDGVFGEPAEEFGEMRAAMAGFYIHHNVGIALQCFSRGVLLGIGTIMTLLYNGIVLGGISGYVLSLGHGEKFLSFVVSHGSFELTAIAIAGCAGLMIGDAFVHSGQRTRLESMRTRGMEAVQIAGGAAVMLVIAALIEAFWSPAPYPAQVKYLVGGFLWLLVALYLGLAGARR